MVKSTPLFLISRMGDGDNFFPSWFFFVIWRATFTSFWWYYTKTNCASFFCLLLFSTSVKKSLFHAMWWTYSNARTHKKTIFTFRKPVIVNWFQLNLNNLYLLYYFHFYYFITIGILECVSEWLKKRINNDRLLGVLKWKRWGGRTDINWTGSLCSPVYCKF